MGSSREARARRYALEEEVLKLVEKTGTNGITARELYQLLNAAGDQKTRYRIANVIFFLRVGGSLISKRRGVYIAPSALEELESDTLH